LEVAVVDRPLPTRSDTSGITAAFDARRDEEDATAVEVVRSEAAALSEAMLEAAEDREMHDFVDELEAAERQPRGYIVRDADSSGTRPLYWDRSTCLTHLRHLAPADSRRTIRTPTAHLLVKIAAVLLQGILWQQHRVLLVTPDRRGLRRGSVGDRIETLLREWIEEDVRAPWSAVVIAARRVANVIAGMNGGLVRLE
jgi:hypothetical protein